MTLKCLTEIHKQTLLKDLDSLKEVLDQLAAGDYDDEASLWDVVYYRLKETIKRVERAGEERALK
jgi:hypothetical protein